MDNAIGVEKYESQSDIMTYVDLNMVGDWLWGAFKEVSQNYHPSAPLEELAGKCQDLGTCPGTG